MHDKLANDTLLPGNVSQFKTSRTGQGPKGEYLPLESSDASLSDSGDAR